MKNFKICLCCLKKQQVDVYENAEGEKMNKAQERLKMIEEKLHKIIGNLKCHCSECIELYLEKKSILLGIEETKKEILEKTKKIIDSYLANNDSNNNTEYRIINVLKFIKSDIEEVLKWK